MNVVQSVIGFRKTFQARHRYGFVLFWRRDIHSLCEMQNQAINFRNCKRQLGVKLKEKHYCLLACNEQSVHNAHIHHMYLFILRGYKCATKA